MNPNLPSRISSARPLEILRKQVGDLHLSLRLSKNENDLFLPEELHNLQQFMDHAVLGMFRSTVDGKLVMANAALANIFGYASPDEMMECVTDIGNQLYKDSKQRRDWEQRFHNQDMVGPVLWCGHRANGEMIWLEEYARVIRESQDGIVGYEGVVLDVTTRQAQEPIPQDTLGRTT